MADISHALTDDFITTIQSNDIYKEACVCERMLVEVIDQTNDFQASRKPVSHAILLGMQCRKPRLVPVPLFDDEERKTDLAIWASMGERNETLKTIIKSVDDAPITIMYDEQQTAPEVYRNELLSDSCVVWKGNVILEKEGGPWKLGLFGEFSWLEGVKAALLAQ